MSCPNCVSLIASSDNANNIVLYDTRGKEIKKLKMKLRINSLAWNPMESMIFTAASDDFRYGNFVKIFFLFWLIYMFFTALIHLTFEIWILKEE